MIEFGPPEFRRRIQHFTATSGESSKRSRRDRHMIRYRIRDIIK
jgi:hypothetical protein